MKHLVRSFLFSVFALWLTSQLFPAMVILGDWQTTMLAGGVLSILMLIVQPMLKILFIPINFLTFGLASLLINAIILYLLTVLVPQIQIRDWTFAGATWSGFAIPPIHFTYALGLVTAALLVALITDILQKVSDN